jgi:hypothetical protein
MRVIIKWHGQLVLYLVWNFKNNFFVFSNKRDMSDNRRIKYERMTYQTS